MSAKQLAKSMVERMTVSPQSAQDVAQMLEVLQLKLAQHPELGSLLLATGGSVIVEACTRRPHGSGLFWGAAMVNGEWRGQNVLGRLWMELRDRLRQDSAA